MQLQQSQFANNYLLKLSQKKCDMQIANFRKRNDTKCTQLWKKARKAIGEKKIFTISGTHHAVRAILNEKGWVEKLDHSVTCALKKQIFLDRRREDFERIILSNMVRFNYPNLIWLADRSFQWKLAKPDDQLQNKIEIFENSFTTKSGLCNVMKDKQWYCAENEASISSPRVYNIFLEDDLVDFVEDYRLTACANLVKWLVNQYEDSESSETEEITVDQNRGDIPYSTLEFAMKQCQQFIHVKSHEDIDVNARSVDDNIWSQFLYVSRELINGRRSLKLSKEHAHKLMEKSKFLLNKIEEYNPLLKPEGMKNVWIVKPASACRGRGIFLETDVYNILKKISAAPNMKFVVQKYIERPLLIHQTKFDIRQYYLVTRVYPLTIWMYRNCYLRFSSRTYTLDDFHESVHLTNNAVQHKYRVEENSQIADCKMWDLGAFKEYLKKIDRLEVWDAIYSRMKMNIIGAMLCSQRNMSERNNCFELYGCDFVLDESYKPWLIEINARPDMNPSTPVTSVICRRTLEDLMKVVIDYRRNPGASTGDFECVYRQQTTRPKSDLQYKKLVVDGHKIKRRVLKKI